MLRTISTVILFCTCLLAQELQIPAIKFAPREYVCYRTSGPLTIDGKLNEADWDKAEWTSYFADIEGPSKPAPRFTTRAKMLWDDNYLYVAAEIQEPDIWAYVKDRDSVIFRDNDFEVFIDPDGNTHRYAEFEMNALNTVWDLLLVQPYRDINNAAINNWDYHGLKTGVSIDGTLNDPSDKDNKWTVEIAFPMSAFKEIAEVNAPPKDKDQWRINFSRVEWKTKVVEGKYVKQINHATGSNYPEDNWVWSPQGVVNMHYPEMWGFIQFATETVGNKKADFVQNKEELAKIYLRQVYYKERNYFEKSGKFTTSLQKLGITENSVPGYKLPAVVECTSDMFEAYVKSADGSEMIYIRNDGLTWSRKIKK